MSAWASEGRQVHHLDKSIETNAIYFDLNLSMDSHDWTPDQTNNYDGSSPDQTKQGLYIYDSEWTLELQASDVGLSEWAKANDLLYTL